MRIRAQLSCSWETWRDISSFFSTESDEHREQWRITIQPGHVTNCVTGNWMIVCNEELWVVTPQSHRWIPPLQRNLLPPFSRSEWGFGDAKWVYWAGTLQSVQWPVTTTHWSGFWILAMTGSGAHPATYSMDSGSKAAGVWALWLHLVPRLRMSGALNSTPPVCLHGMYKDQFTVLLIWVEC
jgi:hypothetical protein